MRSKHRIHDPHRKRDAFLALLDDDERRIVSLDELDELDDREQYAIRIGVLDIPQPSTMGGMWVGLDATPTGSDAANDVVGDFTGTTQTLFDTPSIATPVTATHSQTLGSTFHPNAEGVWLAYGKVQAQTAASVRAGIGFGNVAGDLSIDPVPTSRTLDVSLSTSVAADAVPVVVDSGPIVVTRNMALDTTLGLIRLLLSNNAGAGAAAAALNLPLAQLKILRYGNIPRARAA